MGDRSFGAAQLSPERWNEPTVLDTVLETYKGTLASIPSQIVVTECYDEYFGIYDQSSQGSNPFALVSMHESEDLVLADPFDVYLEKFLAAGVLKFTGMDFNTFLGLTRDRAEAVLRRCDAISSKEDTEVDNLLNGVGLKS